MNSEENLSQPLHIAFGIHNSNAYHVHALVSLYSIMARTASPVTAHILADSSLSDEDFQYFSALGRHFGNEIIRYDTTDLVKLFPPMPALENFSRGCLFKLLIPGLVPADTVIYFDSDVLGLADARDIFNEALNDAKYCIWAATDEFANVPPVNRHIDNLGLERSSYFNSGVVVFKNSIINRLYGNFLDPVLKIANKYPNTSYPDQDILNLMFYGASSRGLLLSRANYQIGYGKRIDLTPDRLAGKIVHYTWRKPWIKGSPAGLAYWQEREKMCAALNLL